MDERENKLPVWAKETLANLRRQVQRGNEPLIKECATLRPLVVKLRAENDALKDLLAAAAKGGHLTAQQIIGVIEEYAPWKDEEEDSRPSPPGQKLIDAARGVGEK